MNFATKKHKKILRIATVLILILGTFFVFSQSALAAYSYTWQFPLAGPWSVTYPFGAYYNGSYHLADDEGDPADTPVYAPANSTIKRIENWPACGNYGGLVIGESVQFDGSVNTWLVGHLDGASIPVFEGQEVSRGQIVGLLGDSNENGCWGTHTHFGIRPGPYIEDPWSYWGYGDWDRLQEWADPSAFVNARSNMVEVSRVPANSPDRYQTATGISQRQYPQNQLRQSVLLASGETFMDGLSSIPLTNAFDAPLLLTQEEQLTQVTEDEIKRVLTPGGAVYILGGPATVKPAVAERLGQLGFAVFRIFGDNREATAVAAANNLSQADTVFITNRTTFVDSISTGAPATINQFPILLTKENQLSPETRNHILANPQIKNVVVVGGPAVISNNVVQELQALPNVTVEQFAGANRHDTNILLNNRFIPDPQRVIVTTGYNFPDAFGGGALVATEQASLVLSKTDEIPDIVSTYLDPLKANITAGLMLGGPAALTETVELSLANLLNSPINATSVAGHYAQAGTEPGVDWQGAAVQTHTRIDVPVPDFHVANSNQFRDATVVTVNRADEAGEEWPGLMVSQIPISPNQSAAEALADWYNMDQALFENLAADPDGLTHLPDLPGFLPTTAAFSVMENQILLYEARLANPGADRDLIDQAHDLNRLGI